MGRNGQVATEAVVLSGGGAKGAYEVGVLQALIEGKSPATGFRPLEPAIYTGTSVGAYNASFLAAKGEPATAAISELAELWLRRIADTLQSCGNGVYRLRGAPLQLGDPGCLLHPVEELSELTSDAAYFAHYLLTRGTQFLFSSGPIIARLADSFDFAALFSPEPFYSLVRETIDPQGLRHSTKPLSVIASNWKLGTVRVFSGPEIADQIGPPAIIASGSIPGIFPPVLIGGVPFVDGGVLMNTPLKPAIHDGADVLHVVYLDPCLLDIPFPRLPNTIDTFYRLYATQQARAFRQDIATVAAINLEQELLGQQGLAAGRAAVGTEIPAALLHFSRILRRAAAGHPYRPLTVHNYCPQDDLGGALGMLDFRQGAVDSLIHQGYQNAVNHDCARALCVLAPFATDGRRATA